MDQHDFDIVSTLDQHSTLLLIISLLLLSPCFDPYKTGAHFDNGLHFGLGLHFIMDFCTGIPSIAHFGIDSYWIAMIGVPFYYTDNLE